MAHLTGTFHRPTHVSRSALAAMLVAAGLVVAVAIVGLGVANRTSVAPAGDVTGWPVRTDPSAIKAQLTSEHLRLIARSWYVTEPAANPNLFYSEYVRWLARRWSATAPTVNPNLLYSDHLREISRDW